MRIGTHILTTALLAGVSVAQAAPASQTVSPIAAPSKVQSDTRSAKRTSTKAISKSPFAPKPKDASSSSAKTQTAGTASAPAKPQVASKPTTPAPHKAVVPVSNKAVAKKPQITTTQKQAASAKPKQPEKVATPEPKKTEPAPVEAQSAPAKLPSPGKRDPFVSPLALAAARSSASNCSTGKRCLAVDQIILKGIVQMKTGNFALVENGSRRPYVLHENDALFNGSVVKITGDTVIFREETSDVLGRPVSKEVVKKVSAPAV